MTAAARRDVLVCVTPYATGSMANMWLTCFGASPVQAMRRTLEKVGRSAAEVRSMKTALGDTVLLSNETPSLPLALIQHELTADEVADALTSIRGGALS